LGDTEERGRYLDGSPAAVVEEEIDDDDEPAAAVVEEEIDDDDAPLVYSRVQPSQLRGESDVWADE
jgi:hypothetical protein